jgi:hypothetical protein
MHGGNRLSARELKGPAPAPSVPVDEVSVVITDLPAHGQQQRQHEQADDEQQLEIIDIGDDRSLPSNLGVERGNPLRGRRVPIEIGTGGLQVAIEHRRRRRDLRVHDLRRTGEHERGH